MAIREIVELVARVTDLERRLAGNGSGWILARHMAGTGSSFPRGCPTRSFLEP